MPEVELRTVVASGSLVSPGGAQGIPGSTGAPGAGGPAGPSGPAGENANTLTTAGFTVPAVGSSVSVPVSDAGWISVGQMVYVDQAGGGVGFSGALQVIAKSGNNVTLLNPPPPTYSPALAKVLTAFAIPAFGSRVVASVTDTSAIFVHDSLWFDNGGAGGQSFYVAGTSGANGVTLVYDGLTALDLGTGSIAAGTSLYKIGPVSRATPITHGIGLVGPLSGNSTDFVDGTNFCQSLATAVKPTIWTARQRSFNAFGNPNFEVDQQVNGTVALANQTPVKIIDRWSIGSSGTMRISAALTAGLVPLPGSNFAITQNFVRITLTTAEPTLTTNDCIYFTHYLEGIEIRELFGNATSAQILVRSSIAGLAFSTQFVDGQTSTTTYYPTLWTIQNANTWTLIQKPNIPVFPSAATFTPAPGVIGSVFYLYLAQAPTYIGSVDGSWVTTAPSGPMLTAPGISNFAAGPVGATFDIAFMQWEPGPDCSGLIDVPFARNLDACLRYFCKSYLYATKPGTNVGLGAGTGYRSSWMPVANATFMAGQTFPRPMAKAPTVTLYNPNTGNPMTYAYEAGTADTGVTAVVGTSEWGYTGFASAGAPVAGSYGYWHHTANTGW